MKYIAICVFFFLVSFTAFSQNETQITKEILNYIDSRMPETLTDLEKIVNINSGTRNIKGVREVGAFFETELKKLGFTVEWINLPDSIKHAGHLYAYRKGKKGKKILLLGHLDTVFEPDQPANPFKIIGDTAATGQGVVDMKSGDMIILSSLRSLNNFHLLDSASIGVYLTGDEEVGAHPAEITRADMIEKAKTYDVALSFESGKLNYAVTSRRGSCTWKINVTGIQAHSSSVFSEKNGFGAIYESARILDTVRRVFSKAKNITISPGTIAGGTEVTENDENLEVFGKNNVIASHASISGDLRFLKQSQFDTVRKKMSAIINNYHLNGTNATIQFMEGIPPMEPKSGNKRLLQKLDSVNRSLGFGEVKSGNPNKRGAGDISFIAKYVDGLDGLGGNGKGAHTPNEILNLKLYNYLIKRATILIYSLSY